MKLDLGEKIDSLEVRLPVVDYYDFEAAESLILGKADSLLEDTGCLVEKLDIEDFDMDYSSF